MIAVSHFRSIQGACECTSATKCLLHARVLETRVNDSLATFQFMAFHISSVFEKFK